MAPGGALALCIRRPSDVFTGTLTLNVTGNKGSAENDRGRDGHALLRSGEPDRRRSGPILHDPA
jgi:hypothetical protein